MDFKAMKMDAITQEMSIDEEVKGLRIDFQNIPVFRNRGDEKKLQSRLRRSSIREKVRVSDRPESKGRYISWKGKHDPQYQV